MSSTDFLKVSLALVKGNQRFDSQNQHVETMHHYTAGKIRCLVIVLRDNCIFTLFCFVVLAQIM